MNTNKYSYIPECLTLNENLEIVRKKSTIDSDTCKITKKHTSNLKKARMQKKKEAVEQQANYNIYKNTLQMSTDTKIKRRLTMLINKAKKNNDTAFLNAPLKQQIEIVKLSFNFM